MDSIGVRCPPARDLLRGGIIGSVELVSVVKESDSPWFFGPRGLVLNDPVPCDFIPCKGALGFFKWERDDSVKADTFKWMFRDLINAGALPKDKQPSMFMELEP